MTSSIRGWSRRACGRSSTATPASNTGARYPTDGRRRRTRAGIVATRPPAPPPYANRALTYTEGIDLAADDPRPVPHAWTTDRHGRVVDLTTLERQSYFGIPVTTALYARCVARDKIARPVLPLLLDANWTPGMPERVAAARLARATKGARR